MKSIIICIWPDDDWCYHKDIEEYAWKSDDYKQVFVDVHWTEDEIQEFVEIYDEHFK